MKIQHRRTFWIHTTFSLAMGAALTILVLVRRDVPTLILATLLAAYIIGNAVIHIRHNDLKRDTLYEYLLLGIAVFIVVGSAAF